MPRASLSAITANTPTSRVKRERLVDRVRRGRAHRPGCARRRAGRSGGVRTTSSRPGEVDLGEAGPHQLEVERAASSCPPPRNASTAASAQAALCAWWAPCSGRNTSSYSPAEPPQREQLPADGERARQDAELQALAGDGARRPRPRGGAAPRPASTGCWASTPNEPGLDDPGLLGGDLVHGRAEEAHVVERDGVTTATWASTTLVASQDPPSPTSTTATSTGASANAAKAIAVRTSKNDSRTPCCASTSSRKGAMSSYAATNRSSSIGWPSKAMRSRHGVQVRAGEAAGPQAELLQQRVDHPGRRRLAVGARRRGSPGRCRCGDPSRSSSAVMRSSDGVRSCSGARSRMAASISGASGRQSRRRSLGRATGSGMRPVRP